MISTFSARMFRKTSKNKPSIFVWKYLLKPDDFVLSVHTPSTPSHILIWKLFRYASHAGRRYQQRRSIFLHLNWSKLFGRLKLNIACGSEYYFYEIIGGCIGISDTNISQTPPKIHIYVYRWVIWAAAEKSLVKVISFGWTVQNTKSTINHRK